MATSSFENRSPEFAREPVMLEFLMVIEPVVAISGTPEQWYVIKGVARGQRQLIAELVERAD